MKPLKGEPSQNSQLIRDRVLAENLIFFDYPLVVHYRVGNDDYIELLCDYDAGVDRVVFFGVSADNLKLYKGGVMSLRELLQCAPGGQVEFIDYDGDNPPTMTTVMVADIPEGYLPAKDSFID
jgi:hypothetical protein